MGANPPQSQDHNTGSNSQESGAEGAGAPPRGDSSLLFQALQFVLGFLGVVVLLIYPLGFITLWLAMARTYGYNFQDALYATSLVPTSVVIGQAVVILSASGLAAICMFVRGRLSSGRSSGEKTTAKRLKLWACWIVVLVSLGIIVVYTTFLRGTLPKMAGYLYLVAIGAVFVGGEGSVFFFQQATKVQGTVRTMHYFGGALIAYLCALIVGVCVTAASPSGPALPTIELQKKHSADCAMGKLLSHSDGYWHVIDRSDGKPLLKAIPNENVSEVTIVE
jgi:hypothetical protein